MTPNYLTLRFASEVKVRLIAYFYYYLELRECFVNGT